MPRPISIVYRRPPRPVRLFPGLLRKATENWLMIQSRLSLARPRKVAGQTIADTGYWAIWFIFKGKWFDVGKFYDASRNWLGYYCDVVKPLMHLLHDSRTGVITDLFLDVWIAPDKAFYVLDEDEFRAAVRRKVISKGLARRAQLQAQLLAKRIEKDQFPPAQVEKASLLEI